MANIFMHVANLTACDYYRAIMPFAECEKDLAEAGVSAVIGNEFSPRNLHDAYFFHRTVSPTFLGHLVNLKQRAGRTIVWDLDDDLFNIPPWSPAVEMSASSSMANLNLCLEIADFITVSTHRLKDFIKSYGHNSKKIHVLPNLVRLGDWKKPLPRGNRPVRVLWAGSSTHTVDLAEVAYAVDKLISEYKDVEFYFMGDMPKQLSPEGANVAKYKGRVILLGAVPLIYYADNVHSVAADVAIAPLCGHDFNKAKSNIKFLEMTMAGAAVAASDVGPYADTITDGYDGLLCRNESDWYYALKLLIDSHKTRTIMNTNAINSVASKYSWERNSKYDRRSEWVNFFKFVANYSA